MSNLVIDSSAWIEYLNGSQLGSKAREMIMDEHNKLFTHAVSVASDEISNRSKQKLGTAKKFWAGWGVFVEGFCDGFPPSAG